MNEDNFDLSIIGAGIIGAFAAWLAKKRHPDWKIALIDKGQVGSGATRYSASLDIPYGHTPLRRQLSTRSRELFQELKNDFPELPIKKMKLFGIVHEGNAQKILEEITETGSKLTPGFLPSILQDFPFLKLREGITIIGEMHAFQGIRNEVAEIICAASGSGKGCNIFPNTEISSVSGNGRNYKLQTTSGEIFYSRRIIQCTGPWINERWQNDLMPGKKMRVKKIVAFHLQRKPGEKDPVFYFFDDDAFLMPKYESGYWLLSFKCDHWDVLPDENSLSIDEADIEKGKGILKKYAPEFVPLCTEGRVFCDAYADNGDPVIEYGSGQIDFVIAGGGAGSGYRLGPAIAEQALNLLDRQ